MLYGGMSAEREVSLSSGEGVGRALVENGYKVTAVDMGADLATVLLELKPDVVFNALHGTYGEDGCVPGLLNILHIPYTHSGVLASSLAFTPAQSMELVDPTAALEQTREKKMGKYFGDGAFSLYPKH